VSADAGVVLPTQTPSDVYNVVSNVDVDFAIGLDMRDMRALLAESAPQ